MRNLTVFEAASGGCPMPLGMLAESGDALSFTPAGDAGGFKEFARRVQAPSGTSLVLDSLPDLWGAKVARLCVEARARRDEVRPQPLTPMTLLAFVCDGERMGSLRFAADDTNGFVGVRRHTLPGISNLAELAAAARRIEEGDLLSAATLEVFAENAVCLGGSRPKASFVDDQGRLSIAKFSSINDDRDMPAWEYAAYQLAAKAGVRTAQAALLDPEGGSGRIFAVRRFDRTDAGDRLPYLSFRALLGASDNREPRSYRDLVRVIDALCTDHEREKEELWRRTVFKCLIHDGDDHLRNQGLLKTARGWELAPAFDLNASLSKTHLTLTYGESRQRDITLSALLAQSSDWGVDPDRALAIAREVQEAVAGWRTCAEAAGIAHAEIERMACAFTGQSL